MPSIEESKRQVKAGLANQQHDDHDAILAGLQDEIDRHNAQSSDNMSDLEREKGHGHSHPHDDIESRPSTKFRFKSGITDPNERKRKHRSRNDSRRRRKRHRRERSDSEKDEAVHPFPREPSDSDRAGHLDTNAAFRESLFDALADDEGAAYWEGVYSQPIHVYPRPTVETEKGELEQMNDEQYAAFVQMKMWEKKNPHLVQERERREKERKEGEEERARRRDEFVRRKERAAWERAQRKGARKFAGAGSDDENGVEDYEYVFDFDDRTKSRSKRSSTSDNRRHYEAAWKDYLAAWDKLKVELLNAQDTSDPDNKSVREPSKCIPWPVLQPKPVTRPNIEEFMQHIPENQEGRSKVQLLKAERVRWHPDKIQQRFGGQVDEGTMKVVTGVFQVVDAILSQEQNR